MILWPTLTWPSISLRSTSTFQRCWTPKVICFLKTIHVCEWNPLTRVLCADLVEVAKPDERAVMTYVSCYYHAFSGQQKVKYNINVFFRIFLSLIYLFYSPNNSFFQKISSKSLSPTNDLSWLTSLPSTTLLLVTKRFNLWLIFSRLLSLRLAAFRLLIL